MSDIVIADKLEQPIAEDGRPVNGFTLTNSQGTTARFMDIGATWLSWKVGLEGETREVLLGASTYKAYQEQQAYLGATVGRYANRIANGKFEIEGQQYQVNCRHNQHALHGGENGFNRRRWHLAHLSENQVTFTLHSDDGDQGFPGQLSAEVTYTLSDDDSLHIDYKATVDKACPVNLTNHAYFDLSGKDGKETCMTHTLSIAAERYLPVALGGIPHGELANVEGTGFDFREPKTIGTDFLADDDQAVTGGYDHSYLIEGALIVDGAENTDEVSSGSGLPIAASVTSPDGALTMVVKTTKPAIQFYSANFLEGCPNRSGGQYINNSGLALETQFMPDSPNNPQWPQTGVILQPDEVYQHRTTYQLIKTRKR